MFAVIFPCSGSLLGEIEWCTGGNAAFLCTVHSQVVLVRQIGWEGVSVGLLRFDSLAVYSARWIGLPGNVSMVGWLLVFLQNLEGLFEMHGLVETSECQNADIHEGCIFQG